MTPDNPHIRHDVGPPRDGNDSSDRLRGGHETARAGGSAETSARRRRYRSPGGPVVLHVPEVVPMSGADEENAVEALAELFAPLVAPAPAAALHEAHERPLTRVTAWEGPPAPTGPGRPELLGGRRGALTSPTAWRPHRRGRIGP